MFITVKFGKNESLLCNPSCSVINLLTNIKQRAGFSETGVTLDLSDEKGLIKELDLHKYDNANNFLQSHSTYILVEKQLIDNHHDPDAGRTSPIPPQYQYVPLLKGYEELFPEYKLQIPQLENKIQRKPRLSARKSPSPAGKKVKKKLSRKR
ncbi:uncharacterized protein CXorf65 homolog [Tubulanus polymorphus]|uniref:uncharacterized protein CXorf65 homolog n=1 Tax=Tubulanus polymorphus TaxID=672921 RepID=UPI003DA5C53A